jgi:hypothetical protein
MMAFCLDYFSTLEMKVIRSSDTSVDVHGTTLFYISEDRSLAYYDEAYSESSLHLF